MSVCLPFAANCYCFRLTPAKLIELLWKVLNLLTIPLETEQQNRVSCRERHQPAAREVWANGHGQNPRSFKWGRHKAEKKQSNSFVISTETMSTVPVITMNWKKRVLEVNSVNYQNWKWDEQPKVWKKGKLQCLRHLLFLIHFHLETNTLPFQSNTYQQVGAGDRFDDWNYIWGQSITHSLSWELLFPSDADFCHVDAPLHPWSLAPHCTILA